MPIRPVLTVTRSVSPFYWSLVSCWIFLASEDWIVFVSLSMVFPSCLPLIRPMLRAITDRYLLAIPVSPRVPTYLTHPLLSMTSSRVRVPASFNLITFTITVWHNMANTSRYRFDELGKDAQKGRRSGKTHTQRGRTCSNGELSARLRGQIYMVDYKGEIREDMLHGG